MTSFQVCKQPKGRFFTGLFYFLGYNLLLCRYMNYVKKEKLEWKADYYEEIMRYHKSFIGNKLLCRG